MKNIVIAIAGMLCLTAAQAQEVHIKEGQKIVAETKLYANALSFDKKWAKLKQEKKDALVLELNAKIEAGTEKPWRTTTMKMEFVKVINQNGAAAVTGKAYDSGFEYQTTSYFSEDTSYLVRNADPVFSVIKGDTLGMAIQGIQKIQNNIKVGDQLSSYSDFAFSFPKTWTSEMSEKAFLGRKSETHNDFGIHVDSETGVRSLGNFKITTTSNVYETVKHEVEISENITSNVIHYYTAFCSRTDKLTVAGTERTAYIIESQQWAKGKLNREYTAERQDLANKTKAEFENFLDKINKKAVKRGYTNADGYIVSYFKEWFVPGYGIVKSESYDAHGAIQSQSFVKY